MRHTPMPYVADEAMITLSQSRTEPLRDDIIELAVLLGR